MFSKISEIIMGEIQEEHEERPWVVKTNVGTEKDKDYIWIEYIDTTLQTVLEIDEKLFLEGFWELARLSVEGKQPKQLLQLVILNLFYMVLDDESASIRTKLQLSIWYSLNIFEKYTTKFGH